MALDPVLPADDGGDLSATPCRYSPAGLFLMINSFETGGTERQFINLCQLLDPERFRVYPGCIQEKGPYFGTLKNVAAFPLGGSLYRKQSIVSRFRLARHLRRNRIAIAHAFDFYANLTLIPAARMAGVPVVIGSHRQLGDLLTSFQFRAQLAAFHFCDLVVCNSRAAADRLLEHGISRNKVVVIGNAIPCADFADTKPCFARIQKVLRVGMIARMNAAYKNHSLLLRAAALICRGDSSVEFLLVGDGPLRPALEREAAQLGIQERVKFLGDRSDIPSILASLDISVMPSDSESLSNAVLESMAAGVSVVATDVGGNRELLSSDRGLLVPPRDHAALERAITTLLQDEELRSKMAENGRQFIKKNFGADQIAQQYETLYEGALRAKHSPHSTARNGKRLRVALIAPTLHWVGGQAVQADLLLRHWKKESSLDISFIPVDPPLPAGFRWTAPIPGLRTCFREIVYWRTLWREMRKVDVAHIFSASYWSFLLAPAPALCVARIQGAKTIINYRSGEARDHLQRFRSAQPILRGADKIIVPSQYLVDVFQEFGLQAEAVPNLVDLSQFSFRDRNPLRPHFICSRGFHTYYCIDVVVKAFAEVCRKFPDARLDLLGAGPTEGEIRDLVKRLQLKKVTFCGIVPRDQIGSYYERADIFINASHLDNMPVSVLEAFASGMPIVSTAPESMRYLITDQETGLLSAPGDVSALAKNALRLLSEPRLSSRLASNALHKSRLYHWEAVRDQWLSVYESLFTPENKVEPKPQ